MVRQTLRVLQLFLCLIVSYGALYAQTPKTITLRMIDGKSGRLIATTDYLVRVNHQETIHANWVTMNDDGTGKLIVPGDASLLSIRASYDSATSLFVNCDSNNDTKGLNPGPVLDRWYSVSDIMATGIVAPNECIGKKVPEKLQLFAKPGEFVFFVRRMNVREEYRD